MVSDYFGTFSGIRALVNPTQMVRGEAQVDVYFKTGLSDGLNNAEVLHEALHIGTKEFDIPVADRLGLKYKQNDIISASKEITKALKKAKCVP